MGKVLAVMTRMLTRAFGLLALSLTLAACSVGNDVSSPGLALQEILIAQGKARLNRGPSPSEAVMALNRADIQRMDETVIRAQIPNFAIAALLFEAQDRDPYTIWLSPDRVSVRFRAGLVMATKGIGADLVSVEDPRMVAVLEGREGPGASTRVNSAFNGVNGIDTTRFTCEIADLGSETVSIVGRGYPVRHLRQSCTSPNENFVNDYWQQGRIVWKSRQWFNDQVGYVIFERLTP